MLGNLETVADPVNAHDKHVRLAESLAALIRVLQRLLLREVPVGSVRTVPQVRRLARKCAIPVGSSIGSGCDCDLRVILISWQLVLTHLSGYRADHRKGTRTSGAGRTVKGRRGGLLRHARPVEPRPIPQLGRLSLFSCDQ